MAMLPHGTMLALTNNNVPAVQLVTIPWNVYGTGCETGECTAEDAAGNFKALAKRNGIKVTSPSGEPDETNGAPVDVEFTTEDAVINFKALARRNGIKITSPSGEPDETHSATVDLSASATEFRPRCASDPGPWPENPELTPFPQRCLSTTASVSPMNEEKKLLEMFQAVLNEKKEQFIILQDCMKEKEESKTTINTLNDEKNELQEEVKKLTCVVEKLKERNTMLSQEVEALTERLIGSEENNARLKNQVATLTSKMQTTENSQESDRTMLTSLFTKLNDAEAEKERAWNIIEGLSNKYDLLLKENERNVNELFKLNEQLGQVIMDKSCAELKATTLADELRQSKLDKDRVETEVYNLTCQLKELSFENEKEKETTVKEVVNCTADAMLSEKERHSEKKMDSLDNISYLDDDDYDQNWTVVQRKTKGEKLTKPLLSGKSRKKVKAKRSHSFDDAMLSGNNDFCSTDPHLPHASSNQEPPCDQVKPVKHVTSVESSESISSTKTTTTTTETFIDLSFFQTQTQPFGQIFPTSGMKNNPPGFTVGSIFESSHPNLLLNNLNKPATKPEKDKPKQSLASFDILMNHLSEKFPSKTRNELVKLLKLAKTTFGDQGFRKKKMEEIVKRIGEIIAPENMDNTEHSERICSICRDEMKNKETVLECGHEFHGKCVKEWIEKERTCPLCRSHALTEEDFPSLA